jgi:hypothetical protein
VIFIFPDVGGFFKNTALAEKGQWLPGAPEMSLAEWLKLSVFIEEIGEGVQVLFDQKFIDGGGPVLGNFAGLGNPWGLAD